MHIQAFELGSFMVTAYVVSDAGEAMLIDAPEGAKAMTEYCRAEGLTPRRLVNTHGHGDHIWANAEVKQAFPEIEIICGADEAPLLADAKRNLSVLFGLDITSPPPDRTVREGDEVAVGGWRFKVLETPGHSPGSISLYSPDGPDGVPVVLTGDALFAGSVGRTDFPGADHETLIGNIRSKLLALPPETVVYPGHGPATTVAEEARANPYL